MLTSCWDLRAFVRSIVPSGDRAAHVSSTASCEVASDFVSWLLNIVMIKVKLIKST